MGRRWLAGLCWLVGGLAGVGAADVPVNSFGEGRAERVAPFAQGSRMAGVGGGVAFGTLEFGGSVRHDLAVFQLHHGWMLGGPVAEGSWYQGGWMVGAELIAGYRYRPEPAVLVGATPLIRYVFGAGSRWKPFVEAGAGVALTDVGEPDLGGKVQFSPQGGAGLFWMWGRDAAVVVQQRFVHYSNGGTRSPNGGMNHHATMIGLARFY